MNVELPLRGPGAAGAAEYRRPCDRCPCRQREFALRGDRARRHSPPGCRTTEIVSRSAPRTPSTTITIWWPCRFIDARIGSSRSTRARLPFRALQTTGNIGSQILNDMIVRIDPANSIISFERAKPGLEDRLPERINRLRRALPGASLRKIPEAISILKGAVPALIIRFFRRVRITRRPPDVWASEDFRANGHGGPVTSFFPRPEARDGAAVKEIAAPRRARRAQGVRPDPVRR